MTFPNYSLSDVDVPVLTAEIRALDLGTEFFGVTFADGNCYLGFASTLSEVDIAAIDAVVAAHSPMSDLDKAKRAKCQSIDLRTRELIATGFEYPAASGKRFSLSLEGQLKLAGINQVRNDPSVVYPICWNCLDDSDTVNLMDADEVLDFYRSAMGMCRTCCDSGTVLKDAVRAANSVIEVNSIIDDR